MGEVKRKTCKTCGALFTPSHKYQVNCSRTCSRKWYKTHPIAHIEDPNLPVIRVFNCSQCGRTVYINEATDKRYRFCSVLCEKKYWKHPNRHKDHGRGSNNGVTGAMSLGALKWREKRLLE